MLEYLTPSVDINQSVGGHAVAITDIITGRFFSRYLRRFLCIGPILRRSTSSTDHLDPCHFSYDVDNGLRLTDTVYGLDDTISSLDDIDHSVVRYTLHRGTPSFSKQTTLSITIGCMWTLTRAIKEDGGDRGWVPLWLIGKVPTPGAVTPTPSTSASSARIQQWTLRLLRH
ncbi:uncharacterized protein EDB91DRAFT_1335091 [Suillus paluster]|uniref:uncharacterized protein n=1 Tax=Suillus paluster TaxID=48578 RepID=UPI001B865FCF|nr:uncharacterized protein EDB91DRAFT_1335091 [Suillus paluster]KAG1746708.1 hypothetical protein EDB91DRAFT_1335091 [Suillus paluster]